MIHPVIKDVSILEDIWLTVKNVKMKVIVRSVINCIYYQQTLAV